MHSLSERADQLRDRFKVLESVRGSGYNDADRNVMGILMAPQNRGLPPASQHVVAFFDFDGEKVVFDGRDSQIVFECLSKWMEKHSGLNVLSMTGTERKLFLKIIPRMKIENDLLVCRLSEWNDLLSVIESAKIGLQGRPFVDDGSPLPGS